MVNNRTRSSCQVCVQFCFIRRLLVLLPHFVVIVEHIKFWGNHSFWPSNITDIDWDGWNITCRWCQDSSIFPRDNIFPQCCTLRENIIPWENITILAVHQNVIFHDRHGQYLYNIGMDTWLVFMTRVWFFSGCECHLWFGFVGNIMAAKWWLVKHSLGSVEYAR